MAASAAIGSRGQLQFSATEAPDMGADETALSDQTAELGTRRVGTTAERNALSGAKLFSGLLWGDTTDGIEYRYASGSWKAWYSDWRTYSATLTAMGVGAGGANFTEYRYLAGTVSVRYKIVLGSSGFSVGTNPNFSLPVTAVVGPNPVEAYAGLSSLYDLSTTVGYVSMISAYTANNARIFVLGSGGIYSPITSSAPFTFASGDVLSGEFVYRAA